MRNSKNSRVFIITIFLVVQVLLLNLGCSVNKDYKTLSFFFDGVPIPEEADSVANIQKTVKKQKTSRDSKDSISVKKVSPLKTVYTHAVYKRESCNKCHKFSYDGQLIKEEPELCYQCHDDYNRKYKNLHGPVAAGFCSACHEPHKSDYKYLLDMPVRKICMHCHESVEIEKNPVHQNTGSSICVDCHNSHGGETLNMLKATRTE